MAEPRPIYDVFISHNRNDIGLANEIAQTLRSFGLRVFTDAELAAGEQWEDALWEAIAESQAFVVVIPEGESSANSVFQLGAAKAWNKPVYAVAANPAISRLPAWLHDVRIYAPSGVEEIAWKIKNAQKALTESERAILAEEYQRIGIPVDQLLLLPKELARLTNQFHKRTQRQVPSEELLRILLRLRKSGGLRPEGRRLRKAN